MDEELGIKICGINVSITSDNTDFLEKIRAGYGQLVWSGSGEIDFAVKMQGLPFLKGGQGVSSSQDLVTVKEDGLEGCFELKKRKGEVFIQPNFLIEGAFNLLKSICSLLVVKKGGLVLHASAVLRQGKAYIFFGPSGSGKSTVAELSALYQGCIVLDEESVFIREVNGSYQASGQKVSDSFPVQGLYKLSKDKEVYLKRLSFSEALAEVFTVPLPLKDLVEPIGTYSSDRRIRGCEAGLQRRCGVRGHNLRNKLYCRPLKGAAKQASKGGAGTGSEATTRGGTPIEGNEERKATNLLEHEMLLANFSKLVGTIPCFDLHFRPDTSFWRCIDGYSKNLSN